MVIDLVTPIDDEDIKKINVGDMVTISGYIYCGRDAVLPKVVELIDKSSELPYDLQGSVIFHTAVSPAGLGPTSSNKLEIENSIAPLSKAGVKIHLGKGRLKKETIQSLEDHNSVFAVIAPVTALLVDKTLEKECIAFPELGMEALYRIKVEKFPAIIGAAHGRNIYDE